MPHFQVALSKEKWSKITELKERFGVNKDSELLEKLVELVPDIERLKSIRNCEAVPDGVKIWAGIQMYIITGEKESILGGKGDE